MVSIHGTQRRRGDGRGRQGGREGQARGERTRAPHRPVAQRTNPLVLYSAVPGGAETMTASHHIPWAPPKREAPPLRPPPPRPQVEAERIMAQLQSENERQDAVPDDGSPKYMPSTEDTDPIVRALKTVLKCKEVTGAPSGLLLRSLFGVCNSILRLQRTISLVFMLAWRGVYVAGVRATYCCGEFFVSRRLESIRGTVFRWDGRHGARTFLARQVSSPFPRPSTS